MVHIFLVIIIFTYSSFLLLVKENFPHQQKFSNKTLLLLCLFLVFITIFRSSNFADYSNYLLFYQRKGENRFEPTAKIFRFLSPNFTVFLFLYAFFALWIKFIAIRENSKNIIFSILTLLSTTFILHDLIQMRVSCAIAIFLYSIRFIKKRQFFHYLMLILLATSFHYSALVFLLCYFLDPEKLNSYFWIFALCLSNFLGLAHISTVEILFKMLPVESYVALTLQNSVNTGDVNLFAIPRLLNICLLIILFFYSKKIQKYDGLFIIKIKIYAISLLLLPLLLTLPVLAGRISQMLGTVVILLLPDLIYTLKDKIMAYGLFYFFLVAFFFIYAFRTNNYYIN
jgi:hypothetical protein